MTRLLLAFVLLAASALPPTHVPRRENPHPASGAKIGDWNMQTSQLNVNLATGRFSAPKHVNLMRADGSTITADRATGNYKQREASLYGNVVVHDNGGTFGLKSAPARQSGGPAVLTSDELALDDAAHLYDADGHVHYEQGATKVDAQKAHLNDTTHELDMTGKVHVVQADRTLDADSATYNTATGDGTAQSNVMVTFLGITPSFATPKPIRIKHPKIP